MLRVHPSFLPLTPFTGLCYQLNKPIDFTDNGKSGDLAKLWRVGARAKSTYCNQHLRTIQAFFHKNQSVPSGTTYVETAEKLLEVLHIAHHEQKNVKAAAADDGDDELGGSLAKEKTDLTTFNLDEKEPSPPDVLSSLGSITRNEIEDSLRKNGLPSLGQQFNEFCTMFTLEKMPGLQIITYFSEIFELEKKTAEAPELAPGDDAECEAGSEPLERTPSLGSTRQKTKVKQAAQEQQAASASEANGMAMDMDVVHEDGEDHTKGSKASVKPKAKETPPRCTTELTPGFMVAVLCGTLRCDMPLTILAIPPAAQAESDEFTRMNVMSRKEVRAKAKAEKVAAKKEAQQNCSSSSSSSSRSSSLSASSSAKAELQKRRIDQKDLELAQQQLQDQITNLEKAIDMNKQFSKRYSVDNSDHTQPLEKLARERMDMEMKLYDLYQGGATGRATLPAPPVFTVTSPQAILPSAAAMEFAVFLKSCGILKRVWDDSRELHWQSCRCCRCCVDCGRSRVWRCRFHCITCGFDSDFAAKFNIKQPCCDDHAP